MNVIDLIEIKHLKGEQKELAETIGIEAYRKLVAHYGGEKLFVSNLNTLITQNKASLVLSVLNAIPDHEIKRIFSVSDREFERIKLGCK